MPTKKLYHDIDLVKNQVLNARTHNVTTAQRNTLGGTLTTSDKGLSVFDVTLGKVFYWSGTVWISFVQNTADAYIEIAGGDISVTGDIIFTQTPPSASGAYKFLVRNDSTGELQQVASGLYQPALDGVGLVRMSGTSISYDNSVYITENQTITLSGDVSGSGKTAITTTIGAGKVTNAMLAGSIQAIKLVGTDINIVGTIDTGTWEGTPIEDDYIVSSTYWNNKQDQLDGTGYVRMDGTDVYYEDLDAEFVHLEGDESIEGVKTFDALATKFNGTINLLPTGLTVDSDYGGIGLTGANKLIIWTKETIYQSTFSFATGTANRDYIYPNGSGTIALNDPVFGGTGLTSYTTGDTIYASGTNVLAKLAAAASGNALLSGSTPSWGKIGLTTHVSGTLPLGNGGTGFSTYAKGDIIYASAINTLSKLTLSSTPGDVLKVGASGVPEWGTGVDPTDFIQNQNASAQTADFWISGNANVGGTIKVGTSTVDLITLKYYHDIYDAGLFAIEFAGAGYASYQFGQHEFGFYSDSYASGISADRNGGVTMYSNLAVVLSARVGAQVTLETQYTNFHYGGFKVAMSHAVTADRAHILPNVNMTYAGWSTTPTNGALTKWSGTLGLLTNAVVGTDYAAATGGSGYIQNQVASPQTAGFNITGNALIGGHLTMYSKTTVGMTGTTSSSLVLSDAPTFTGQVNGATYLFTSTSAGSATAPAGLGNNSNNTSTEIRMNFLTGGNPTGRIANLRTNRATSGASGDSDMVFWLATGGTITEKMRLTDQGRLLLNSTNASPTNVQFYNKNILGSSDSVYYGSWNIITFSSSNTGGAFVVATQVSTQAASYTIGNLWHYSVGGTSSGGTIGAGSTITNNVGYFVGNDFTMGTNNYAFYSALQSSGTNNWSLWLNGSALNYLNGNTFIGTTSNHSSEKLQVLGNAYVSGTIEAGTSVRVGGTPAAYMSFWATNTLTGSSNPTAFLGQVTFGTGSTTSGTVFRSMPALGASVATGNIVHFQGDQGNGWGGGATATNEYGFYMSLTTQRATNNYGLWLYVQGTGHSIYSMGSAPHYLASKLKINSSTSTEIASTYMFEVSGRGIFTSGVTVGTHAAAYSGATLGALRVSQDQTGQGIAVLIDSLVSPIGGGTGAQGLRLNTLLSAAGNGHTLYGMYIQSDFYVASYTGVYMYQIYTYNGTVSGAYSWNVYAGGGAPNYFEGKVQIGYQSAIVGSKLYVHGEASAYAAWFNNVNTSNVSFGIQITAGTNANDTILLARNAVGNERLRIDGLGRIITTQDVYVTDTNMGLILRDRVGGTAYRLKITSGVLGLEAA